VEEIAFEEAVAVAVSGLLRRLSALPPHEAIQAAQELNQGFLNAQAQVATLRRSAVRQLRSEGHTLAEIGEAVGMTPQRVQQIEAGYDRREAQERNARRASLA